MTRRWQVLLVTSVAFAGFSSAAVAELRPAWFATGSAITNCFRQVGAVLGISALVALLGTPSQANALHLYHPAWALMALTRALTGVIALALGRVRARNAGDEPTVAQPATVTPSI